MKEILLWAECYQSALHTREKSFVKGRANPCGRLHRCLHLENCHATPTFSIHHPDHSVANNTDLHQQKDYDSLKA